MSRSRSCSWSFQCYCISSRSKRVVATDTDLCCGGELKLKISDPLPHFHAANLYFWGSHVESV